MSASHALVVDSLADIDYFWNIVDATKSSEKYRIDKNLQYLQYAPLNVLKKIFVQYRFFTHFYITDLAILISKLPFGQLRSILAEILNDELGNGNAALAHPNLYDDFLLSIGIPKNELIKGNKICLRYLENIQTSLKNSPWIYGLGLRGMGGECLCQIYLSTMHEFFSKNTAIISLQDEIAWHFWEIHIGEVDLHHQTLMRDAINNLISDQPELIQDLLDGYLESKTAWDEYWDHIFSAARRPGKYHLNQNELTFA